MAVAGGVDVSVVAALSLDAGAKADRGVLTVLVERAHPFQGRDCELTTGVERAVDLDALVPVEPHGLTEPHGGFGQRVDCRTAAADHVTARYHRRMTGHRARCPLQ